MADILVLALLVAFFALAVVFVRACEHIIGPDLENAAASDGAGTSEPEAAAA